MAVLRGSKRMKRTLREHVELFGLDDWQVGWRDGCLVHNTREMLLCLPLEQHSAFFASSFDANGDGGIAQESHPMGRNFLRPTAEHGLRKRPCHLLFRRHRAMVGHVRPPVSRRNPWSQSSAIVRHVPNIVEASFRIRSTKVSA